MCRPDALPRPSAAGSTRGMADSITTLPSYNTPARFVALAGYESLLNSSLLKSAVETTSTRYPSPSLESMEKEGNSLLEYTRLTSPGGK